MSLPPDLIQVITWVHLQYRGKYIDLSMWAILEGKMRVVAILGSPRPEGNSNSLARIVLKELEAADNIITTYHLNRLKFMGCQGCSACKGKSNKCVLHDDLAEVLQAVMESDILIFATPVYWGDISGQMKLFIDRTYSFLKPDFKDRPDKHRLPPGKRLVWIETQGAENENLFADIFARYNNFFEQLNYFEETYRIRGCGLSSGVSIEQLPELISQAEAVGKNLAEVVVV